MKKTVCVILVCIYCIILMSCQDNDISDNADVSEENKKVIHFLNWGDYIETDTIAMFEEENPDIKVVLTTVPSNEEMYIVSCTEGSEIDVIIPSEYMTQKMIKEDKLAEIDYSQMDNFKYVRKFAEQYSYEGSLQYAVPYMWGTLGILYNKSMVHDDIDSWQYLFDDSYAGKIFMYDSIRDAMCPALKYLGYSMNTLDNDEVAEATQLLISQKPSVLAYCTDEVKMSMVNGSGAMALVYAGDAVYAMQDNADLEYVVPKEGSNIFVDNFCILKSTDVYDEVLRFIDYMCRPDIAAMNSEYIGYCCPVEGYADYIEDDSILDINAYNPDLDLLPDNMEYYNDLGDGLKLYEKAWMEIKAR